MLPSRAAWEGGAAEGAKKKKKVDDVSGLRFSLQDQYFISGPSIFRNFGMRRERPQAHGTIWPQL